MNKILFTWKMPIPMNISEVDFLPEEILDHIYNYLTWELNELFDKYNFFVLINILMIEIKL